MKIRADLFKSRVLNQKRLVRGFTLAEIMVAAAVFGLMISAFLFVHIYGLKLNQLVRAKMGASDDARRAVGKMVSEIQSAGTIKVGTGTLTSFTEATGVQQGNAIQIQPIKGDTNFIRYFWDNTDKRLKRSVNGAKAALVVANAITNSLIFTAEDYLGNTNANNLNNRVIETTLQFYQLEYPTVPIGPGSLYDYYQLRTRITRRALE